MAMTLKTGGRSPGGAIGGPATTGQTAADSLATAKPANSTAAYMQARNAKPINSLGTTTPPTPKPAIKPAPSITPATNAPPLPGTKPGLGPKPPVMSSPPAISPAAQKPAFGNSGGPKPMPATGAPPATGKKPPTIAPKPPISSSPSLSVAPGVATGSPGNLNKARQQTGKPTFRTSNPVPGSRPATMPVAKPKPMKKPPASVAANRIGAAAPSLGAPPNTSLGRAQEFMANRTGRAQPAQERAAPAPKKTGMRKAYGGGAAGPGQGGRITPTRYQNQ
jgi:hypothetical protein